MRAFVLLLGSIIVAVAQAAAPAIPLELEAWRTWVLKDQEFRDCPLITGSGAAGRDDFVCEWPGLLSIAADAQGANLSQRWHVEVDGWVPLAGSHEHWPQQVSVDGKAAPVVDRNGPWLWLVAGDHDVRARMNWAERPQALPVPASIALIALEVDGKPVIPLQRSGNQLTLGRGVATAVEADSVDLRVFRMFSDGIPGELSTQVRIYASGQAREEVFGPALPEGFVPLALSSQGWAARLDDEGRLHVQVQPGENTVTLTARASAPVNKLTAHLPEQWADQEIWSYASVPALRVTSISGAVQVDPRQADVPEEWSALPAYAMSNGDALTIDVRSRGLGDDVANRLNLHREAWLDFSGDGWFARDRISGQMQSGWRFDVAAPFLLQRAQQGDSETDALLITKGANAGLSGVEWRATDVNLRAGVRIDSASGSMLVAGWQQVFDQVNTTLHLPYGYRLIAAPGTDGASNSWMSHWTLLDVFLAAILVLLGARLLGWAGGVLTGLYLLLGYQESGSPLWTLLAVLALALIARALPAGRLLRAAVMLRMGAIVLLLIVALPFAAGQLRQALHPQLEQNQGNVYAGFDANFANKSAMTNQQAEEYDQENIDDSAPMEMESPQAAPPPPPPPQAPMAELNAPVEAMDSVTRSSIGRGNVETASPMLNMSKAKLSKKYSQSTVVQTGAGEPGWQLGNMYTLSWSGPVQSDQEVRLLIASPWLVRSLRIGLVGLLGLLLWRIAGATSWRWPAARTGATAGLVLVGSLLICVPLAQAQEYPPEALLQQLQARLVEAPKCAPQCANIAQAQISVSGDELRVTLEVHAMERVAVPLPADDKALLLRTITLDGVASDGVAIHAGKPWVAVSRGVHRVELVYVAAIDRIALAFPMAPERVQFSGESWLASGLADERLLTETLTIVRARANADQEAVATAQRFPPYVRVFRELSLDLEWSVQTGVQRLAPREGGFTVSLATIEGEHVTTPGLKFRDGKLTVALADAENLTLWDSTLEQTESISLTAPELSDHAEVWRVLVSPTWHVEFSGVPETGSATNGNSADTHLFEFNPLPGETLTVRITKPVAADGATRAIDTLRLSSEFGLRARTHTLQFDVRASQGGEQAVTMPKDAELLGVTRDGATINARSLDGKLSLPLSPGAQKYEVRFRDNAEMSANISTPEVSLGLPVANITLAVTLPNDRWLLAAFGPAVGPAVLFWGELLVMIVLAWLLSRWRNGGLRFHHWLLLVLGFSTFSWLALLVVVVWLFALDWRAHNPLESNWKFNLGQLGLAGLSLVALVCLFESIRNGLLGSPDMVVRGYGSSANTLQWFADRSIDALPTASVVSLPLWIYNVVMLFWALWLAWAVVGWLRSGFAAWMQGGYWRPWQVPQPAPEIEMPRAVPPPV